MSQREPDPKTPAESEELDPSDLDGVSGGLNPQPLPPRVAPPGTHTLG